MQAHARERAIDAPSAAAIGNGMHRLRQARQHTTQSDVRIWIEPGQPRSIDRKRPGTGSVSRRSATCNERINAAGRALARLFFRPARAIPVCRRTALRSMWSSSRHETRPFSAGCVVRASAPLFARETWTKRVEAAQNRERFSSVQRRTCRRRRCSARVSLEAFERNTSTRRVAGVPAERTPNLTNRARAG
jgi:hypothetical protein